MVEELELVCLPHCNFSRLDFTYFSANQLGVLLGHENGFSINFGCSWWQKYKTSQRHTLGQCRSALFEHILGEDLLVRHDLVAKINGANACELD